MTYEEAINVLATLIKKHPNERASLWDNKEDKELFEDAIVVIAEHIDESRRNA